MEDGYGEEETLLPGLCEGDPEDEDIMPMDRSRYPDNWDEISKAYKDSIGWRCEECGIRHMEDFTMGSCLTVHHLDHDPENPNPRLRGLCARCHLRAEIQYRLYGFMEDQLKLFEEKK